MTMSINIYNKVRKLAKMVLPFYLFTLLPLFMACSDTWNDHYDNKGEGMNDATLWQAITQNSSLSNFAKVVQACGYDKALNSSQVFTVFAPTNDNFSSEEADELITAYNAEKGKVNEEDNTVMKEFIYNHIAMYNHSTSATSNDSLVLMNGKKTVLSASSFGNNPILTTNGHYSNGVLFTIQGKAPYFPTVFEYLRKDADLDSIASFFYNPRFYRKEFIPGRSVAGGLENGKTVYLDSVFVQQNDLWDMLWAYTNEEDSTYWMVAPTNKEWKKLIEEYEPYFNYAENVPFRDSLVYTMPRMAIVDGTTFSRTLNSDAHLTDSALSTSACETYVYRQYYWGSNNLHYYQYGGKSDINTQKPYSATGIFSGTDNVECSNGQVMKSDDWKINKLNTFHQWIIIEAENERSFQIFSKYTNNNEELPDLRLEPRIVQNNNRFYGKVWDNEFAEFKDLKTTQNHTVRFYLRNVLSNIGYDIYIVTAPALANDSNATGEERIPAKFSCAINRHNVNGSDYDTPEETTTLQSSVVTNPDVVDYILLAEDFKFPIATYGLSESLPTWTLDVVTKVTSPELRSKKYTRTLRIDCIMLVPHGISNVNEERFEISPHGDGDTFQWLKY